MIDTLITSRVRRKIVTVYAKYPDYRTHIRGLSFLIKEDVGNVYRELCRLEKTGFLFSSKKGRVKIYGADKRFPLLRSLQTIVLFNASSQQTPSAQNIASTDMSSARVAGKAPIGRPSLSKVKASARAKAQALKASKATLKTKAKQAVKDSRATNPSKYPRGVEI